MDKNISWRTLPEFYRPGKSSFKSIQALFSEFLRDRHSPSLLQNHYGNNKSDSIHCGWGDAAPLEKEITSQKDLDTLINTPFAFNQSICIVEPADHVGFNTIGEPVRASINVAWLAQRIADCDSIVFPLWKSGLMDRKKLAHVLTSSLAVVLEGWHPTVRDSKTFDETNCSHADLLDLSEELILSRRLRSAPSIFICLGHQLAAQAHIRLIKKATHEILETIDNVLTSQPNSRNSLKQVCNKIQTLGTKL